MKENGFDESKSEERGKRERKVQDRKVERCEEQKKEERGKNETCACTDLPFYSASSHVLLPADSLCLFADRST